jgi:3-deoxy-D-manno-octulosonic-acid transferase
VHACNTKIDMRALSVLIRRVAEDGPRPHVLLTGQAGAVPRDEPRLSAVLPPAEIPQDIGAFLARWRPDAAVWSGAPDRPQLLEAAARSSMPLILANATGQSARGGRVGRRDRQMLHRFHRVLARDGAAGAALSRLGVAGSRLEVAGILREAAIALPCDEDERAQFAALLKARPVWFAARVPAGELGQVVNAHVGAARMAHRLLLILQPGDLDCGPALAATLRKGGCRVALRSDGDLPGEETSIYIADRMADDDGSSRDSFAETGFAAEGFAEEGFADEGLWFRLAPVTLLGGTLRGPGPVFDVNLPAALGSAVVAGPRTGGRWGAVLHRFAAEGAARRIGHPDALANAVSDLLAPDKAAALAHNAWALASDGAETTDRLAELICDALDGVAI